MALYKYQKEHRKKGRTKVRLSFKITCADGAFKITNRTSSSSSTTKSSSQVSFTNVLTWYTDDVAGTISFESRDPSAYEGVDVLSYTFSSNRMGRGKMNRASLTYIQSNQVTVGMWPVCYAETSSSDGVWGYMQHTITFQFYADGTYRGYSEKYQNLTSDPIPAKASRGTYNYVESTLDTSKFTLTVDSPTYTKE